MIDVGWLLNGGLLNGGRGFACPLKVDFESPGLECPLNRNVAPRNAGGGAVLTGHLIREISSRGFQNSPVHTNSTKFFEPFTLLPRLTGQELSCVTAFLATLKTHPYFFGRITC